LSELIILTIIITMPLLLLPMAVLLSVKWVYYR